MNGYKDLEVYKRAYNVSLELHKITLTFPKLEQFELASQIRRASKSVAINVAEGYGKNGTTAEFKRFLTMALGSSEEMKVELEYCKDLGYISEEQFLQLTDEYVIICKMLMTMLKKWQ